MSQATLSSEPFLNSNLFSGHYLTEKIQGLEAWECDEDAENAREDLRMLWKAEKNLVDGYNEDQLIDTWITNVLRTLGYDTMSEVSLPEDHGFVDRLLFRDESQRREATKLRQTSAGQADLFAQGSAILEAKQWDASFTTKFDEGRPYRNASHQIKHYLEKTPSDVEWGILTNGRKWRLYGTRDYETETYYEVDLPELLESGSLEDFKYFYVLFRPAAFESVSGETFLDRVYTESETAAQELGEDLQNNVFTALRVLGRGFVETNDLEIDPDDEAALAELKEQSLVLLYRLMFVLYAESRGLIHPESTDAVEEYEENFSLDSLRLEIHEEIGEVDSGFDTYSEYSTTMWSRLEDLFRLIDEGEDSLGIPPYNGGLFDQESHEFLSENAVSNKYLAEVIYRISTTENDEGRYVLADYADLDTRHLGSVYEGLLEHQFRIAPEDYAAVEADGGQVWKPATEVSVAESVEDVSEGSLYVVNDEGERKATGAYYTPDYVVTYIVEETVDPLLEDIREDLESQGFEPGTHEYLGAFYRRVTNLKILDPAMGSGHFLTRATSYVAKQVMEEVRDIEEATAFDEQKVRRDVAKECIYGVDLNGMAVELAKLSMWLETLAADQPLAFLDHHLKAGNSLVGSDVTEVLSNGPTEDDGGQLTLQQSFARVRERTLDHVMDRMQELLEIDNETLADVKSMEELYEDVRSDPFYGRLFELTNVHTAERFDLEVPEGAYERMAQAIDDDAAWAEVREEPWFQTAQAMSEREAFFHWELEYPEVFFNVDGEKLEDAGFDAVVGNPPYVSIENLDERAARYQKQTYWSAEYGRTDIYLPFIEKSVNIAQEGGRTSMIVPDKWLVSDYGTNLREYVIEDLIVERIWDLRDVNVFQGVSNSPIAYVFQKEKPGNNQIWFENGIRGTKDHSIYQCRQSIFKNLDDSKIIIGLSDEKWSVCETIMEGTWDISDFCYVSYGAQPGSLSTFVFESREEAVKGAKSLGVECDIDTIIKPFIKGRNILPYSIRYDGELLLYLPDELHRPGLKELFEVEKIAMSEVATELKATFDTDGYYGNETVVFVAKFWTLLDEYPALSGSRGFPDEASIPEETRDVDMNYVVALINSTLLEFYFESTMAEFLHVYPDDIRRLPIRKVPFDGGITEEQTEEVQRLYESGEYNEIKVLVSKISEQPEEERFSTIHNVLAYLGDRISDLQSSHLSLNLNFIDYIGSYSDGPTLSEIGLAQPPQGAADSPLTDTAEDLENLRVGTCEIVRESPTSLEIRLSARYKPENDDEFETDRWGYTETDPLPALRLSDLSELEADLIEAFVPVAIEEAGGFADFRETATKTNSLVDRLRKLTLPALEDVREGLAGYLETKARAEELEEKIEKTDALIDEIVYELYGLTDEEIEIVEEAVDG
ncbi:Eco57I restriction-modification methylase domain-containing protein [Natrialbaceae archaeon A-gly3]